MEIKLTVNGTTRSDEVQPRLLLDDFVSFVPPTAVTNADVDG